MPLGMTPEMRIDDIIGIWQQHRYPWRDFKASRMWKEFKKLGGYAHTHTHARTRTHAHTHVHILHKNTNKHTNTRTRKHTHFIGRESKKYGFNTTLFPGGPPPQY